VEIAVPAFLTIILMPFAYSITVGMGAGFVMYVLIRMVRGKAREVHWLMYLIAVLSVAYFLRGALEGLLLCARTGPARSRRSPLSARRRSTRRPSRSPT